MEIHSSMSLFNVKKFLESCKHSTYTKTIIGINNYILLNLTVIIIVTLIVIIIIINDYE